MSFTALETVDQILSAAARHGLALTDATLDEVGLDFRVVHATDDKGVRWIVRAPRRADVLAGAHKEARVLAAVRAEGTVAVPDWRIVDEIIAYPRLGGIGLITFDTGTPTWNHIDYTAPSEAFFDALGKLLAGLQRVPASPDLPARTIAEERAEVMRIAEIAAPILQATPAAMERWRAWTANDALWPTHTALSHGDLHPGHLLMENDATISGVLDWTEARFGDPSIDFAMMHRCFGRAGLDAIVRQFAVHGGTAWPALVEHAIERDNWALAAAAEWAARTNNMATLEQVKAMWDAHAASLSNT